LYARYRPHVPRAYQVVQGADFKRYAAPMSCAVYLQ
jgi:hypothetical protein